MLSARKYRWAAQRGSGPSPPTTTVFAVKEALRSLLGVGEYSALSIVIGAVLTLTALVTGLAFGLPGVIFTIALAVMGVFVVAVVTSAGAHRPGP